MYSVSMAHSLKGLDCINYNDDKIIKLILNGAKNIYESYGSISANRRVANTYTLKLISHELASSNWCDISKQVVWACCTTAFFASIRLGEVLSDFTDKFNQTATLLWKNVKFLGNDEILLYIPCIKKKFCGDFVDVFAVDNLYCPVRALYALMQQQIKLGFFDLNKPVFAFSSSYFLTTRKLNEILKDLLKKYYNEATGYISCHSFRGALVNIMQSNTKKFDPNEYRLFGRWSSDAYLLYLKNHRAERRTVFKKLSHML
jgi:hypothetical protein